MMSIHSRRGVSASSQVLPLIGRQSFDGIQASTFVQVKRRKACQSEDQLTYQTCNDRWSLTWLDSAFARVWASIVNWLHPSLSNVHHEEVARQINRSIDLIDVDTSICIAFELELASMKIALKAHELHFTSHRRTTTASLDLLHSVIVDSTNHHIHRYSRLGTLAVTHVAKKWLVPELLVNINTPSCPILWILDFPSFL